MHGIWFSWTSITHFLIEIYFEEVYMDLLLGYSNKHVSTSKSTCLVCKLHKSLYGLKQESRQRYSKFSHSFISFGFFQFKSYYTLFTRGENSSFVSLLVYVDDIIIVGQSHSDIDALKSFLKMKFKLKDLGPFKYFLRMDIVLSQSRISLCQRQYTLKLLEDIGFLVGNPTTTPMDPTVTLSAVEGKLMEDASLYRRLIGRLYILPSHTQTLQMQ